MLYLIVNLYFLLLLLFKLLNLYLTLIFQLLPNCNLYDVIKMFIILHVLFRILFIVIVLNFGLLIHRLIDCWLIMVMEVSNLKVWQKERINDIIFILNEVQAKNLWIAMVNLEPFNNLTSLLTLLLLARQSSLMI